MCPSTTMWLAGRYLNMMLAVIFLSFLASPDQVFAAKKSYIVYLGAHSHGPEVTALDLHRVSDSHHALLASILGSTRESARDAIFYSYKRHINGFAATLDEEDAEKIAKHPDVVSVFPNRERELHTTSSWDFLMLENANGVARPESLWKKANFGKDIIIANLDTGVWPESKSFRDHGYGPIPPKWKGSCENSSVPCNRKLIGSKYFNKAYQAAAGKKLSPKLNTARDHEGHGTHTLSTAGGNPVPGPNLVGFVINGTAKGGSPLARLASYKVCWPRISKTGGCYDGDILEGFDNAIHDGVDVISVSLGGDPEPYFEDGTAIGAFHALMHNIVVVASAGNDGPLPGSVTNVAPWLFTVAASTIDREYQATADLPTGLNLQGQSLSKRKLEKKFYPLIYAGDAKAANATYKDAELCLNGTLDRKKAEGKILVCLRGENARLEKGYWAAAAGAVGMILANDVTTGDDIVADPHFLPATHISYADGLKLLAYMNSTHDPKGFIQPPAQVLYTKPAPMLADFSSRGPNIVTPEILKPDITGPGVNIIAAYSGETSPTEIDLDTRKTAFAMLSGTSMSCPHISGIVGLLKTLHPDWSPAAIKSAIMTTARTRDNTENPMLDQFNRTKATPLGYGAGHVRPNRAMDPGLVYDLTVEDQFDFLCGLGYNQTLIRTFAKAPHHKCPKHFSLDNFNYPSITVTNLGQSASPQVVVTRKLKNVGSPGTYVARLRHPVGVSLSVEPSELRFDRIGEEKSFKLTLAADDQGTRRHRHHLGPYVFGELLWSDGRHYVRSPIVVASPGAKKKN